MPQTIQFHLDEHIHGAIADGLRRRGIDVTTTAEAQLISGSDDAQLSFARNANRVLVTSDADFLRLHANSQAHAGIVYSRNQSRSIREMLAMLVLIWEQLSAEEMRSRVEFI